VERCSPSSAAWVRSDNSPPNRSSRATRSVRSSFEARLPFEPLEVRGHSPQLGVQILQLLLIAGFEPGGAVRPTEQLRQPRVRQALYRDAPPLVQLGRMDAMLTG